MTQEIFIAHSKNTEGNEHDLSDHLFGVSRIMEESVTDLTFKKVFRVTGLLHDLVKYSLLGFLMFINKKIYVAINSSCYSGQSVSVNPTLTDTTFPFHPNKLLFY